MTKPQTAAYKNIPHFLTALIITALIFSTALSILIVFAQAGVPILQHGLPMCPPLISAHEYALIPYTACGCAIVEIILVVVSLPALWFSTPRLYRQFIYARQLGKRLVRQPQKPVEPK